MTRHLVNVHNLDFKKGDNLVSLVCAIQMDPLENVDINTDSTFMLALEAQIRGHTLFHYLPEDLSLYEGSPYAIGCNMKVMRRKGDHFKVGPKKRIDLAEVDVVLMRQDPPFDMSYITATHFLEHIHPKTVVVNNPAEVRNAPEKLFVTLFRDLTPPTLMTRNLDEIVAFRAEHSDIILKPIYGCGGAGVFHIKPDDENLQALVEMFTETKAEPIIVQRYLPEVRNGDKRIILVNGQPVGAVNRVPPKGDARANFHAGGSGRKTHLTKREIAICTEIGPVLRQKGLMFVGIDVIGDYLTEINVTSPTGIQEINALDGIHLESLIWDAIESQLSK